MIFYNLTTQKLTPRTLSLTEVMSNAELLTRTLPVKSAQYDESLFYPVEHWFNVQGAHVRQLDTDDVAEYHALATPPRTKERVYESRTENTGGRS